MPRKIRDTGSTGWSHIIIRGINRENLFYDDDDYAYFQRKVKRFQKECGAELPIMCLMSNHVHFLLHVPDGIFAPFMKKITVSYAFYYNKKYERVGHVFQDRFRSEPVNDERYLLTVARYIYQNPQKAGVCNAADYPYTLLSPDGILSGYFDADSGLRDFLSSDSSDYCLEYDSNGSNSDAAVLQMLSSMIAIDNPQKLQSVDKAVRDDILCKLKRNGISIRQISRVTGINRNIIQRA
ncbi:MAG: transposase [Paludibacteraceae bacterium]|nr:transposase [Paludibacteraceae bacterium]